MKKILFLFTFFVYYSSQAQTVNIPDSNFKNVLLNANTTVQTAHDINGNNMVIDINEDNEIQESEAESVYRLVVSGNSISDLTGISSFINMDSLNCSVNNLTELNIGSLNENLRFVNSSFNSIFFFEPNLNSNLVVFAIGFNSLTSIDVSENDSLVYFSCGGNSLTTLDVSNNFNLNRLHCAYSPLLTYINLKNGNNLNFSIAPPPSFSYYNYIPNLERVCVDQLDTELTDLILEQTNHDVCFVTDCSTTDCIITNCDTVYSANQNYTICPGDSLLLYDVYQNTTGVYYDTLQTINGCDSILTTTLTHNPIYYLTRSDTVCEGDSILIGGIYQNTAGIYVDSLQSINGCDSIINSTLFVNSVFTHNQSNTICQGDSILLYSYYQNTPGVYYDTLQTNNGCDSILSTTLTLNPIYYSTKYDTICQGDSILLGGIYQATNGVYIDTFQSINGCDSIVNSILFVNSIFTLNQNSVICPGDSILLYGVYHNTSGIYYDTLQTIYGCDSVLSTTLALNPLTSVNIASFNPDTLCITSNVVILPTAIPIGGYYSGNGVIGNDFDPSAAGVGTHEVIYTYSDGNSCLNMDTTIVTVDICTGINNVNIDFGITIYPNPSKGQFTIEKLNNLNKEVQIKLLDVTSKLILEKIIPFGNHKIEMDIRNFSKGIYYLHVMVNDEYFVKKILRN